MKFCIFPYISLYKPSLHAHICIVISRKHTTPHLRAFPAYIHCIVHEYHMLELPTFAEVYHLVTASPVTDISETSDSAFIAIRVEAKTKDTFVEALASYESSPLLWSSRLSASIYVTALIGPSKVSFVCRTKESQPVIGVSLLIDHFLSSLNRNRWN